ncbi:hypothetical protein M3193_07735 [Sporosarcina luteola]|uniref:hypothetical protein n=1 Tax=Sporosarcina luteola TaxID=582850 RepID=UPI002041F460|nr:hypothetical protein [Sporosarcina luteola]MCM3744033.1 hypothetical protein [Sporosarcina luteola]
MLLILVLLLWNVGEMVYIYGIFRKKQTLFDDRYTKTMCMALSSISSFVIALYLQLLLPLHFVTYFLPSCAGLWIGWKFGSFMKAPASLNGMYNGAIGGIMGMMFGAVLQNPAICNIPIETEASFTSTLVSLVLFCAALHTLVHHFIRNSLTK